MEVINLELADITRVFLLTALSFLVAVLFTPAFTSILYQYRLGKRIRDTDVLGKKAPVFVKFHKEKEQTPTMGGVLIWFTALFVVLGVSALSVWLGLIDLNLFAHGGVKLLLFTLVTTGLIGAADDLLNIFGIGPHRGGFAFWIKLPLYLAVASGGAWWFAYKLDWLARPFHIPAIPDSWVLGGWYIPLFILVVVFLAFTTDVADGLDGLAGGLLAICYAAYILIALAQGNIELAAFCGIIVGALLAFLWFNIYPARFFMGDTGSMSLGMTLAAMAFLTNTVIALPIIAGVIVLDGLTSPMQIASKRLFGKKIFRSAPVHHHFQAIGWPEPKIVMRFWVLGAIMAAIGLAVALFGQG